MLDIVFLCAIGLWSATVGLAELRRLGFTLSSKADAFALAIPLGLGTLSLGSFALAEVGMLDRPSLFIFMLLGAIVGTISALRRRPFSLREKVAEGRMRVGDYLKEHRRFGIDSFFDIFLVATLLGTFLTALAPVTDGDALCYHLQVPKIFLLQHAASFDPDLHETVYPPATEMLYAVALAFRGPVACRLIQWLLGVAFALNVMALARPFLADRARWAGTIALLVPAISNGMGAPLNDVALASYGNAALFAFTLWFDQPSIRRAILVGVLSGCALGVKYPALVWTAILGTSMSLSLSMNRPTRSKPLQLVAFTLAAMLIGGFWYARAYYFTGNPVHPFFRNVFGGAGLDEVLDPIKRPLNPNLWNLATASVRSRFSPIASTVFHISLDRHFYSFCPLF